jgi:hypothetical protein
MGTSAGYDLPRILILPVIMIFFLAVFSYGVLALFECEIIKGIVCPKEGAVDVYHMWINDSTYSHAEMPDQTNYDYRVCC